MEGVYLLGSNDANPNTDLATRHLMYQNRICLTTCDLSARKFLKRGWASVAPGSAVLGDAEDSALKAFLQVSFVLISTFFSFIFPLHQ